MAFEGSCHCGKVTYSVDGGMPTTAISCNCSHCRRKGFLLAFFPREQFTLTADEDALETYSFNTHRLEHLFCRTCGTQGFAYGSGPDGTPMAAVNLRCVPTCDIDGLSLQKVDGASF